MGIYEANNTLGIKNVYWVESEGLYVVSIKKNGKYFRARSSTLEGAIAKKEELIEEVRLYMKKLKEKNHD